MLCLARQVEAYLNEAAERAALTGAAPAGAWRLPEVVHAPGFDLYTGADAAKHAHEAGCALRMPAHRLVAVPLDTVWQWEQLCSACLLEKLGHMLASFSCLLLGTYWRS